MDMRFQHTYLSIVSKILLNLISHCHTINELQIFLLYVYRNFLIHNIIQSTSLFKDFSLQDNIKHVF